MLRFLVLMAVLGLTVAKAAASEFDWMVREFARESGARPMHVPLFGFLRLGVAVAHPAGASQLKLAVFEHASLASPRFSELTDMVAGRNWKPMIRIRSRNGESTNIYAQPSKQELRLLITALDRQDATFVELKIRPQQLIEFVDEHRNAFR